MQRTGLALSGGGFRAAFFHVGVLARLAEIGVLPGVEVISTVSGGSIVGALYYLRLRRLLESRHDSEIEDADYVRLVADVERRLRGAVQENIRARAFANPFKNVRMLGRKYSRSDRIGDLYDRCIYKPAWGEPRDSNRYGIEKQIELHELLIEPEGIEGFHPDEGNTGRRNKVPILVVNATSLNSGHNWRFEATRMGEPLPDDPAQQALVAAVDKNVRLQQSYFDPADAPAGAPRVSERQRDFPLALAVAASAAVPAVFHPLAISDLYEGIRVQLVDGGVQDNQGVQALLDQDCERLLISDASGQMADKDKPLAFVPNVALRSMSVAEDRIRDGQLVETAAAGATVMHLRMGLEAEAVPPLGNDAKREKGANVGPGPTSFGVDREVQDLLSRVRTDLDYFSDTEALSLELDGYLIATGATGAEPDGEAAKWGFLTMLDAITAPDDAYRAQLRAGKRKFFRSFRLRPLLATAVALLAIGLAAGAWTVGHGPLGSLFEWCWPLGVVASAVLLDLGLALWANAKARMPWLYE